MTTKKLTPFPYSHWSNATEQGWIGRVVAWFEENYVRLPQPEMARNTMSFLLGIVFEILRESRNADAYTKIIGLLGKRLKGSSVFQSAIASEHPHHLKIAQLLEIGLQSRHSHLFMLPQISKSLLLTVPDYSTLLLAAKFHAAGEYTKSRDMALPMTKGCSLALYIVGQSERRLGLYDQAEIHLTQCLSLLEARVCICPFGQNNAPICNDALLRATSLRAKAVVLHRNGKLADAERCYSLAEKVAEDALRTASIGEDIINRESKDTVWIERAKGSASKAVADVVADIHFSHGYYWYHRREYEAADRLFTKAVSALEEANEPWDSPYTRLAIVKFCKGEYQDSRRLFIEACTICEKTPIEANREAPLSLSLCVLGLKVLELTLSTGTLTNYDLLNALENAIALKPKLTFAPLECHYNDAAHFFEIRLSDEAKDLVQTFRERILKEICKIQPSYSDCQKESKMIKILFLAANPTDTTRIRTDEECRAIDTSLRESEYRDRFVTVPHLAVSIDQIQELLLRHKPNIVHFSGHGSSSSELVFDDGNGMSEYLKPESLSRTFSLLKHNLQCVVLNACYSELQAKAIAEHVDCVIGISQAIGDKSAINFAKAFYRALGYGESLHNAFELGCNQVDLKSLGEQDKPNLIALRKSPQAIFFV